MRSRPRRALWKPLADEIAEFALAHFFDGNGVLHEFFDADWKFARRREGRIVEPGHQYEWAWLLLRWAGDKHPKARAAALKLIEDDRSERRARWPRHQQLLDDFSPHDASARLWPQTERLKAAALAARLTGEAKYFAMAASAADRPAAISRRPDPGPVVRPHRRERQSSTSRRRPAASITWSSPSRKSARSARRMNP